MIDPRGPRFAATLTTIVLALVLVTSNPWLLTAQVGVFAIAAIAGLQASPYSKLFARFVRPRLAPPDTYEDERPPRFAQSVGLGFGLVGLVALLAGWSLAFYVAIGAALAAAFLNAAFSFCLGCEVYLLARRITSRTSPTAPEVTTS
jgi:hypothetical protein